MTSCRSGFRRGISVGGEWGYRRSIEDLFGTLRAPVFFESPGNISDISDFARPRRFGAGQGDDALSGSGNAAYTEGFIRPSETGAQWNLVQDRRVGFLEIGTPRSAGGFEIGTGQVERARALWVRRCARMRIATCPGRFPRTRQWDQSAGYTGKISVSRIFGNTRRPGSIPPAMRIPGSLKQELTFGRGDRDALSGKTTYNLGSPRNSPVATISTRRSRTARRRALR